MSDAFVLAPAPNMVRNTIPIVFKHLQPFQQQQILLIGPRFVDAIQVLCIAFIPRIQSNKVAREQVGREPRFVVASRADVVLPRFERMVASLSAIRPARIAHEVHAGLSLSSSRFLVGDS